MKIRILETAEADLRHAAAFYELQSNGLGEYFLKAIKSDIKSLLSFAGVHAVEDGFHRLLAKRFPFAIYYLVEPESIDVYAILDCRRDPAWIAERLRK